jgi:hypothetical protein
VLNIQVLALTLIPLLSGVVPNDVGVPRSPLSILSIEDRVVSDFMVGTWKCSDDFFRWGVTDRRKARINRFKGTCLMTLRKDGTMRMVNLFRPPEGRWEVTDQGLLIYDPKYPERGSQVLPVRKRDENRIWLLLPFAQGSSGIGMIRVTDRASSASTMERTESKTRREWDTRAGKGPVEQVTRERPTRHTWKTRVPKNSREKQEVSKSSDVEVSQDLLDHITIEDHSFPRDYEEF